MSYFDEFGENRSKIPYDDVPISRNEQTTRSAPVGGGGLGFGKFSKIVISFLIVVNLVLTIVCVYFVRNSKSRVINNYNVASDVTSSSMISSAAYMNASLSSICVAAGGTCESYEDFNTKTDSRGSGVIYRVDDDVIYFVTCHHVIWNDSKSKPYDNIWVLLSSSLKPIKINNVSANVKYSSKYDLAVLKLNTSDLSDTEWVLGSSKGVEVFDSIYLARYSKVFTIGNSVSKGFGISEGNISKLNEEIPIEGKDFRTIWFSADINPGNSGGGLFNERGEFIGIVNAKMHDATSNYKNYTVLGMSYAIPSSTVCGVVNSLIETGKVLQIDLGLSFENLTKDGVTYAKGRKGEYSKQSNPIETYSVYVSKDEKNLLGVLNTGSIVESIEYQVRGTTETRRVTMFNKYVFDDISYQIEIGSSIKIYFVDGSSKAYDEEGYLKPSENFKTISEINTRGTRQWY